MDRQKLSSWNNQSICGRHTLLQNYIITYHGNLILDNKKYLRNRGLVIIDQEQLEYSAVNRDPLSEVK